MPVATEQPLFPSLLDRLIDLEPDQTSEPLWRGSYRVDELREHVRRDLEFLLNTRHGRFELLKDGGELAVSTLTYGLPDFTGRIGGSVSERERVRAIVEKAIQNFEPRLRNVQGRIQESDQTFDRDFQLTIHAVLYVNPIVESVSFDTIVESTTGTCEVKPR